MPRTPVALAYPETRYAVPSLPDLSSADERERLSPAALKALFKIARHWKVRDEDVRRLMGGISSGAYYLLKQDPRAARPLDEDKLLRVSYLIGIFKSLNILYSERLADQWMQLPNTNPIFGGRTPLEYLLGGGGIRAMEVVRRLLDARRGGR